MSQLPSVIFTDEEERSPLQRQSAPPDGEFERKRDQSHVAVTLRPGVVRLQM